MNVNNSTIPNRDIMPLHLTQGTIDSCDNSPVKSFHIRASIKHDSMHSEPLEPDAILKQTDFVADLQKLVSSPIKIQPALKILNLRQLDESQTSALSNKKTPLSH